MVDFWCFYGVFSIWFQYKVMGDVFKVKCVGVWNGVFIQYGDVFIVLGQKGCDGDLIYCCVVQFVGCVFV